MAVLDWKDHKRLAAYDCARATILDAITNGDDSVTDLLRFVSRRMREIRQSSPSILFALYQETARQSLPPEAEGS